jgi:phosphoglycerate kinase
MARALPGVDTLGDLTGRRVLLRCDLNVPLDGSTITDDGRIRASLPQIGRLRDAGAAVTICAHLGRPKGAPDPRWTLAPVAARLGELLDTEVAFVPEGGGASVGNQPLALLENVRFHPGETSTDDRERAAFAARLAEGAHGYVDDAFGAVHRKHASVYDVALLLPHAAGELVQREVAVLQQLTETPERPYIVVLGGAKVSDKLAVIERLLPRLDRMLVGGGMCFTFLAALGHPIGDSLVEPDQLERCRALLGSGKLTLPTDVVVAAELSRDGVARIVPADAIPAGQRGLDIGPQSVSAFDSALEGARTVFWNGPMGVFEYPPFAAGTRGVAEAIARLPGALTVVGGGDSAAAVRTLGIDEQRYSHISTGGGASLEYLEGKALPGLTVLES